MPAPIPSQMHAIQVHAPGGPEALQDEMLPVPQPGAGEALVKLEAIGVNFIDVYHRTGLYPLSLPFIPGMEGAGVVAALGEGVTTLRVGDRVAYQGVRGAYAEYAVVPADRLVSVPNGVSMRDAAALMLQGLTAHVLATSTYRLHPGDTCLIHAAAGGVGLLLCQVAKLRGAHVIGTVSTPEKAALAHAAGADDVINYTTHDFLPEVKRLTDNRGVQVVYDSVGKTTFDRSLDCLALRGMMVLFGQSSGPVPPFDIQTLNAKGSLYLTRPTMFHYVVTREALTQRTDELFSWVKEGQLSVRINREVPLANAADAHRALEARQTTGKVLLVP